MGVDRGTIRLRIREEVNEILPAPPTTAPSGVDGGSSAGTGLTGGTYIYAIAFIYDDRRSDVGPISSGIVVVDGNEIDLSSIPIGAASSGVIARDIYRTETDGTVLKRLSRIEDNTTTTFTDDGANSLKEQLHVKVGIVTDDMLNFWINHYNQQVAERTHHLVFEETVTSVSTTFNSTKRVLSLRHKNFRAIWADSAVDPLKQVDVEDLDKVVPDWDSTTDTGKPAVIFRRVKSNLALEVFPRPTSPANIKLRYTTVNDVFTVDTNIVLAEQTGNTTSNLDAFVHSIIYGVCSEVRRVQKQFQESIVYKNLYDDTIAQIREFIGETDDESQLPATRAHPTEGARPQFEEETFPSQIIEGARFAPQARGRRRR